MNNRLLLLCIASAVISFTFVECKGGRGGGGHSSHGGHFGGHGGGHGGRGGGGGWFSGWFSGGSKSHSYPHSTGYSGHGSGGKHTYPQTHGMSGTGSGWRGHYQPSVPTFYTAPQHVYVTQYSQSNSRYGDLLTGLTMYNMGRSHSHTYYHHYYHDDYYRRSNPSTSSQDNGVSSETEKEEAACVMKIKEQEKVDVLSIPCAIVNTFSSGATKPSETLGDSVPKVCVNGTVLNSTSTDNSTSCTLEATDPLAAQGPPINSQDIQCTVEIHTKKEVISNDVDCNTLLQYAKMPVPVYKESKVLPHREKLQSMLKNPPWWLSFFIAV